MAAFGTFTAYGKAGTALRRGFYATNLFSVLICLSGICYGLWFVITKKPYAALIGHRPLYVDVGFILIVIGIGAVINAAIGFYSSWKEMRCFVYTFSVASLIIGLMLVMGGVMGFVFEHRLTTQLSLSVKMRSSMQQLYGLTDQEQITQAWDSVQINYQCCGVNREFNYTAWHNSKWYGMAQKGPKKQEVPSSCCTRGMNGEVMDIQRCKDFSYGEEADSSIINTKTCHQILEMDLLKFTKVAAVMSLVMGMLLIIPAAFGAGYARVIQK